MRDGKGPRPDSRMELLGYVLVVGLVFGMFGFFTGLDAQVNYIATAPGDYFLSDSSDGALYFNSEQIDDMNDISSRSIGFGAVASERLYCGTLRNGNVREFRLADFIFDSSRSSVSGSCVGTGVDLWVHSQPDGSTGLSEEDKSLESSGASYTCVQYSEIAVSMFNGRLGGLNCWEIDYSDLSFEPVPVYKK